jgi:transposase
MERFTKGFSLVSDLLATFAGMDDVRSSRTRLGTSAPSSRWNATHRLERSHRRRNVFPGEKRGQCVGKTKRGKGTKIMLLVDGKGTPLAADISSASPHEVTLIEPLLDRRILRGKPDRLLYDLAADSDPLRARLKQRGIELLSAHRSNRTRSKTQDGRKLRRLKRRWKVERTISWLFNFRRLIVRHEHHAILFLGLVHLACVYTTLQRL